MSTLYRSDIEFINSFGSVGASDRYQMGMKQLTFMNLIPPTNCYAKLFCLMHLMGLFASLFQRVHPQRPRKGRGNVNSLLSFAI